MNGSSTAAHIRDWPVTEARACHKSSGQPLVAPFSNILAVYNGSVGSDDVLARAVALAAATGASLTVVNPLGVNPGSSAIVAEEQKRAARIVPWIIQAGAKSVSTDVVIGTPYVEISCRAMQHEHDLVIASAADDRGLKNIFRSTTAVNLMRKCPSAVWLVKPGAASRSSAIMAIVDAPTEGPSNALGIKVLDAAAAMASVWGAGMHVVQSWEVHGNEAVMLRSEITDTTKHAILTKHEVTHRKALEELLGRYRKLQVPMEMHLPKGRPAENVVTLADRLQVGLIVIGTEGRIGVAGLFKGSSAEQVLQDVDCDVLSVKPDHFRTPISNP